MTQEQVTSARPPVQSHNDEIDLGYLLAVCWDHRKVIVAITSLCTLLGVTYALLATPIHRADALLQVEKPSNSLAQSEMMFLMGQEGTTSATQMEILKSRMVLGDAAEQIGLDLVVQPNYFPLVGKALVRYGVERPGFAQGWGSVWANENITVSQLRVDPSFEGEPIILIVEPDNHYRLSTEDGEALGQGRAGETLRGDNSLLELTVASLDAPAGSEFTLVKRSHSAAIRSLQQRFSVTERGRESGILELSLSGEDPNEISRTLNAISQVYLLQNINRQSAEAEKRLAFLEQQAPEIRSTLTESEDRLNAYRAAQESVDLSFETQSLLQQLVLIDSQLNELQLREAELAERFTRSHPSYQTLLEKKSQLSTEKSRLEGQVERLPVTQQQVLRLNRDVEVTQQIYMQMLNTMQELRIARAGNVGNVRILDDALVAPGPVAPRRSVVVVIAIVAGMMLALIVVLARKMMNRGVEQVDQLQEIGLPVYATVPLSDNQLNLNRRRPRQFRLGKFETKDELSGGMLAWSNPTDLSIEALRSLRTSLHFAMLEAGNNRLMLTGPSPAIGKSFIASNLAAVCAQSGQKVLLIDADLRKGHVHKVFKSKSADGLSDYLAGKLDKNAVIRHTSDNNLDYVARGTVPPNPSELLMHKEFSAFLEAMSSQYDLIIIDTPPVLAVTDAAIVGNQTSTALMIVRFQVNSAKEVERTMQQLTSAGVNVKGAILNAIERSASASYGYGYGYYNYTYRSESS